MRRAAGLAGARLRSHSRWAPASLGFASLRALRACARCAPACLAVVLLLAAPPRVAHSADWIAFRSEPARFAVELPQAPVEARSSSLTAAGRVRTSEFTSRDGAAEFRIEVHELPALATWLQSEASLLARAERDFAADEGARDLVSRARPRAGHPGRHLAYTAGDGRAGRAWLVLVDRRLYLLAALEPSARAEQAERFFVSFETW
jgi:hypothetical protein